MNERDDDQDSNEDANDPEAATPVSLMSLLGGYSTDEARMGCIRYQDAEHVFFTATQVMLNYLAKKWAHVCDQPSGPSHWLAVFQLACEITERDEGDFILCALFAPIHELGRDWANTDGVHSVEWTDNGLANLDAVLKSWRNKQTILERHVPLEYSSQIEAVLRRMLYWNGMRWYEDQITPDDRLKYSLEGFHPSLTAAADACMDAEYITMCLWGDTEPNPKLAHTTTGRQMLHDMIIEREDDDDSEGEEWKLGDANDFGESVEGESSLNSLLGTISAERARMECLPYYCAESVFFRATQVTLNALPPASDELPDGVCGHPFGPSHWLSVFQIACQIAQQDKGDFILCALFAPMHEAARDWRTEKGAVLSKYAEGTTWMVQSIRRTWPELDDLILRYGPQDEPQFGPKSYSWGWIGALIGTISHAVTRWHEGDPHTRNSLPPRLEEAHPALRAAAHACLDADYIHSCIWKLRKPLSHLGYTAAGKQMLQQLQAE